MRGILKYLAVGGLVLASGGMAVAQDSMAAFGSYPAGITTGSSYGFFPGGYRQGYVGVPTTSGYALAPRTSYYSSGFYGGVPGSATYGTATNYSAGYYGTPAPAYGTYGYGAVPSSRYGTYGYGAVPSTGYGSYYAPQRGFLGGRSFYRR